MTGPKNTSPKLSRLDAAMIARLAGFVLLAGIFASMAFGGWLADAGLLVSLLGFVVFVFMQRRL
jgi:hypothetical protein